MPMWGRMERSVKAPLRLPGRWELMPSRGVEESPAASLIWSFQNRGLARGNSGQSPKSMPQLPGYSNNGEAISACAPATQHRDTQSHSGTERVALSKFFAATRYSVQVSPHSALRASLYADWLERVTVRFSISPCVVHNES